MEQDLELNLLLSEQEEQAILKRIFAPGIFQVFLIPSFECNLRCPQCYVGHLLAKPSGNPIGNTDPDKLISFIHRAQELLGRLINFSIVGGEPFLHPEAFRRYLDADFPVNATTNGIFEFKEVSDIIGRLTQLTFSIDGWPEQHNLTRKSLTSGINPFLVTYRNLCQTTEAFPDLDVSVQGSIIGDQVSDAPNALRYYTLMLAAGVKRNKISLGPCAATLKRNATEPYLRIIATSTRKTPCCDHLTHKGFYIYNNQIYGSYHRFEEFPPIASLDDPIDTIIQRKKQFILDTMPILNDQVCMKECKAVGICWGLCTSARHVFTNQKPSSICDRQFKEAKVLEIAQLDAANN